jgi:hypothetical protein
MSSLWIGGRINFSSCLLDYDSHPLLQFQNIESQRMLLRLLKISKRIFMTFPLLQIAATARRGVFQNFSAKNGSFHSLDLCRYGV